ncbi:MULTISPECIES: ABC transporter ATP-binding protein [Silvimonas]|uniref:ABC transporter ATP-binding protein n=1 Tax=Silvimonas TaxID=300264 RepID=UPI0024B33F3D|nr:MULTISPECIES: ABC transporter ATP-binding protein [Silvimonas]MDR3426471.1 ABC transporter ATP-binding protein [Silvimonas sp.]
MSHIQLKGLQKRFGDTAVLADVDLDIKHGEFCVFIGPSGCGKSTLLRIIAGLEAPSGGDIFIGDVRVNDVLPAKRDIAMVFQSYALYPHMTVEENMAFGLRHLKLPEGEIEQRLTTAAQALNLTNLLKRKPKELSGGQRQRVAIGRAIVRKPKVFLFDEPLSNLDAALRVKTRVGIAKLHQDLPDVSMIYVTHDQVEAMTLGDKIVLLRPLSGKDDLPSIAQVGHPLELYHHPANLFVAAFIGSPSMNFMEGVVRGINLSSVEVTVAGQELSAAVEGGGLGVGTKVTLGIRPEHIQVGSGALSGKVVHVEPLGEHTYLHLETALSGQSFIAKTAREDVKVGDVLPFTLPAHAMHLFDAKGDARTRIAQPEMAV